MNGGKLVVTCSVLRLTLFSLVSQQFTLARKGDENEWLTKEEDDCSEERMAST